MSSRLKYLRGQDRSMGSGIYTLILRLDQETAVHVGSLGEILFRVGYYAYTGSARGPGGLKRVKRHLSVLEGSNPARRWHIDYLLPFSIFEDVVVTKTAEDLECDIARKIGAELTPIPGFGCTDCRCLSHLHFSADLKRMSDILYRAHNGS